MCDAKKGCQRTEELKGAPETCSADQMGKCHGDADDHPCVQTTGCKHPEKLERKPSECSREQMRECHGDVKGHSCVEKS